MTRKEQKEFVAGLLKAIADSTINKIEYGDIPARWTKIQLREYLKDLIQANTSGSMNHFKKRRAYIQDLLDHNL